MSRIVYPAPANKQQVRKNFESLSRLIADVEKQGKAVMVVKEASRGDTASINSLRKELATHKTEAQKSFEELNVLAEELQVAAVSLSARVTVLENQEPLVASAYGAPPVTLVDGMPFPVAAALAEIEAPENAGSSPVTLVDGLPVAMAEKEAREKTLENVTLEVTADMTASDINSAIAVLGPSLGDVIVRINFPVSPVVSFSSVVDRGNGTVGLYSPGHGVVSGRAVSVEGGTAYDGNHRCSPDGDYVVVSGTYTGTASGSIRIPLHYTGSIEVAGFSGAGLIEICGASSETDLSDSQTTLIEFSGKNGIRLNRNSNRLITVRNLKVTGSPSSTAHNLMFTSYCRAALEFMYCSFFSEQADFGSAVTLYFNQGSCLVKRCYFSGFYRGIYSKESPLSVTYPASITSSTIGIQLFSCFGWNGNHTMTGTVAAVHNIGSLL